MNYAIDSLMRAAEDAEIERESHAEEVTELTAQRDAAREDLAAVEEYLAGIVRAWQRAGAEGWRMENDNDRCPEHNDAGERGSRG